MYAVLLVESYDEYSTRVVLNYLGAANTNAPLYPGSLGSRRRRRGARRARPERPRERAPRPRWSRRHTGRTLVRRLWLRSRRSFQVCWAACVRASRSPARSPVCVSGRSVFEERGGASYRALTVEPNHKLELTGGSSHQHFAYPSSDCIRRLLCTFGTGCSVFAGHHGQQVVLLSTPVSPNFALSPRTSLP